MVIVYHIGEPKTKTQTVKVKVCDVKYVNSRGKSITKETRCDKNGVPYAKGYRSARAKDLDDARAKVLRVQDRDYEAHYLWAQQKDQPNAKSLNEMKREVRRSLRVGGSGAKRKAKAAAAAAAANN